MKLTVSDLYGLDESLTDLSRKELPINTTLVVKRNLSKVADELRPINEMRTDLINKHKESANGNLVKIKESDQQKFHKKMNELMEQEVDVKIDKIKLSDLTSIQGIMIKAETLTLLDPILIEGEENG